MFERRDYWPFLFGVFLLGGLLAVPLIWGAFTDVPTDKLLLGSLLGCGIFAFGHNRDGSFALGRFLLAFGFVFMTTMKAAARGGEPIVIPGGLLGFLVMGACGWLGIWIGRLLHPATEELAPESSSASAHVGSAESVE